MLETLILGWILTWFKLDTIFVEAINQVFNTTFNTAIYWFIFITIGFTVKIIKLIKTKGE